MSDEPKVESWRDKCALSNGLDYHLIGRIAEEIARRLHPDDWLAAHAAARALQRDMEQAAHAGALRAFRPGSAAAPRSWRPALGEVVWVKDADADAWFLAEGWPYTVHGTSPPRAPAPVPKPLPRQRAQEDAILQKLSEHGHDPLRLPKPAKGATTRWGLKEKVRKELPYPPAVFDKAWQRLRKDKRIKDGTP